MNLSSLFSRDFRYSNNYWVYFLVFSFGNAVLAYSSLSLVVKLWIGLFTLAIPFGYAIYATPQKTDETDSFGYLEWTERIPGWVWPAFILLAIPLWLFCLIGPRWLLPDEGLFGFLSLELSREWSWHFFFSPAQAPPLFNWLFALFIKLFGVSFFSMRWFLLAFLLGILVILVWATRVFFKKSFAFLCLSFFCFGFWPMLTCKYVLGLSSVLFFQLAVLGVWGSFLRKKSFSVLTAFLLGALLGLGFWVVIPWLLVLVVILPPVFMKWGTFKPQVKNLWIFVVPLILFSGVFLVCSIGAMNGEHARWLLLNEATANGYGRLRSVLSNLTSFFWEGHPYSAYGPSWGGILNPFEGAVCFIGVLELIRNRKRSWAQWLMVSVFLFVLPGVVTSAYEINHDLLLLPLLVVICALGLGSLLKVLPEGRRWVAVCLFFLVSAGLNFFHLYQANPSRSGLTTNCERAYETLNFYQKTQGPGLIFQDLSPDTQDQTMTLATYAFNAALNPKWNPSNARWAAVIVNANYRYFLSRRFPDSRWFDLGPDSFWNQGDLALVVLPVDVANQETLRNWMAYDLLMHRITTRLFFDTTGRQTPLVIRQLMDSESQTHGDPFLESLFCEKVIFDLRQMVEPGRLTPWLHKAIEKGYPAPHLLTAEGLVLLSVGKGKEARKNFRQAVQCPFDTSSASRMLLSLKR